MANAARGLPQLAHLLQVFPAMERAAWPGSGFHSGASPKKNRLARPDKAMDGKADQLLYRGLPSRTRTPPIASYDAGKKVSGIKRHIAVDTQGLPHAIHVTTADVTDRAGALAAGPTSARSRSSTPGSPLPLRCKACWEPGGAKLHTFVVLPKRWVVERSFAWLEKCRRLWKNCERKLNTSSMCQNPSS